MHLHSPELPSEGPAGGRGGIVHLERNAAV